MALFQDNIYQDAIGSNLPTDWTVQTGSYTAAVIASNTTNVSDRVFTTTAVTTSGDVSWNPPGSNSDEEILVLGQLTNGASLLSGNGLRWASIRQQTGVNTRYSANLIADNTSGGSTGQIFYVLNGTVTGNSPTFSFNWSVNTWYWCRFRASGTTLSAKFWGQNTTEPSSFNISWTDSNIASGTCGVGFIGNFGQQIAYFSVGTGGDTAPGPQVIFPLIPVLSSNSPGVISSTRIILV